MAYHTNQWSGLIKYIATGIAILTEVVYIYICVHIPCYHGNHGLRSFISPNIRAQGCSVIYMNFDLCNSINIAVSDLWHCIQWEEHVVRMVPCIHLPEDDTTT